MRGVTDVQFMGDCMIIFQPALPMRGVTSSCSTCSAFRRFQPALPMRGVTSEIEQNEVDELISTRTPHAGSDKGRTLGAACD